MLAVATFWLALCLPGYALLRWLRPSMLDGGLLSNVALSYLATFTLLSPVSIAAYLLELPLPVLSIAIVVCVLGALLWLLRELRGQWRWPKPSAIGLLAGAVVTNDAITGLSIGSPLYGDARYHIARVRMLVAFGFNSWDPLVAGRRFEAIYHTNLYHALIASACQLTASEPANVWVYSLSWAKLAAAASIYHLAYVVLGRRWLGWIAAAMFSVSASSGWLLVVPHNITMFSLVPLGLAFAIQVLRREHGLAAAAGFAATAVLLPQFHRLCYVLFAITVAPLLLARLAHLQWRGLPGRRELAVALLGLGLGAASLAPDLWQRAGPIVGNAIASFDQHRGVAGEPEPEQQASSPTSDAPAPRERRLMYRGFTQLGEGRVMFDPALLGDPRGMPLQLLLVIIAGLFSDRRPQIAILATFVGVVLAVLYVPVLCTALFHVVGTGWIVARLYGVLGCIHAAVYPGPLLLLLARGLCPLIAKLSPLRRRLAQAAMPVAGLCAALGLVYVNDGNAARFPWEYHWEAGRSAATLARLDYLEKQRAFLRRFVPKGSIVAAPLVSWFELMMTCDGFPLAVPADRGNYGVADMSQRRADLRKLVGLGTPLAERLPILRHYGIHHIWVSHPGRENGRRLQEIYAPIVVDSGESQGAGLLVLDLESPPRDAPHRHRHMR